MSRIVNLIVPTEILGYVKVGEVTVNDDGSFTGQFSESKLFRIPEHITKTDQPCVFSFMLLESPLEAVEK